MIDIVIPYRSSPSNELLYSLRSIDKNLPHKDIYIIGHKYKGLKDVNFVPFNQSVDVGRNTFNILHLAIKNPDISEKFIWTHDDIFIMNRRLNIPVYHRGFMRDILDEYKSKSKYNYYVRRMQNTYKKLVSMGISNPLCYELHVPFIITKKKWLDVSQYITHDLNKLTMYANLNNLGGVKTKDVKVRNKDKLPSGGFISTHDATFGSNSAGALIRDKFKEKCRYEI